MPTINGPIWTKFLFKAPPMFDWDGLAFTPDWSADRLGLFPLEAAPVEPIAIDPNPLYPRKNTLSEAVAEIESKLPITDKNTLMSALGLYHNTLLHVSSEGAQS